jgi:hypothetical protein
MKVGDWITWISPGGVSRVARIQAPWPERSGAGDRPDAVGFDLAVLCPNGMVLKPSHSLRYLTNRGCSQVASELVPELEMRLLVAEL